MKQREFWKEYLILWIFFHQQQEHFPNVVVWTKEDPLTFVYWYPSLDVATFDETLIKNLCRGLVLIEAE